MKIPNLFRRKKSKPDPIKSWYTASENFDILCHKGYLPLDKNEDIRRCVNIIADLVSSMTIMLLENGEHGDVRLKNSLAKKIDVNPNRFMTRKNFIFKIVSDMLLYGNCVVFPEFCTEIYISNLTVFDINKITFFDDGNDYFIRCENRNYDPDDLLHFAFIPDDDKPYMGQGLTKIIKRTVDDLLQAEATKTGFLQSKWKPSLIISYNADIEDLGNEEFRKRILDSYVGSNEAGEPWLIPAGEIDIKTVQPLTLKDLAVQEGIEFDKKSLARAFGIPPPLLGIGEFKAEEYNNFISTTIMSIAQNIAQELTKKLLYSPNMYFKFNPKSLMQYSLSEKIGFVKEMVAIGLMSRNEGRNEFDYTPVNIDGMNDFLPLENYIPIEKLGEQNKLGGDL